MPAQASGRRYAQAVLELAGSGLEKWQSDLNDLAAAAENPALAALLENPRMPIAAKREALRGVVPGMSAQALNLGTVLAAKNRFKLLAGPIARAFEGMVDERRGIARLRVVTAIPVERAQQEQITRELAAATGLQVRAEFVVDAALQGGMVVRIGDRVLDGSVRSKLEGLKRSLVG